MGNAVGVNVDSAEKYKAEKLDIYRKIKSGLAEVHAKLDKEQPDLSPLEFDQLCSEELAESLGVSEDLVKAIAFSKSPAKEAKAPTLDPPPTSDPPATDPPATDPPVSDPPVDRASPPLVSAPTLVDISSPGPSPPKDLTSSAPDLGASVARVSKLLKTSSDSRFHHFLVGTDGSDASFVAFEVGLSLRKAKGKFYALHIEDKAKNEYLPSKMKWAGILEAMEPRLAGSIPPQLYNLECIQKSPSQSTKTAFVQHVNSIDTPMYICLGWVGRKGPKDDPTVLGGVSDLFMRGCSHPVVICKRRPRDDVCGSSKSFVVCVDGG
eukprot:CAMPEP_0197545920 /NCGR_PEP_ID=MMETSP1320-20131121/763_1 /TAXON_ID=91990 /ORGANISM="Bolidomonas sp., Strain RCC2347" /LENGTH=321 /DNA_ID=CAMNT_0043105463 /DNA_START=195 /DNA_END=1156 /DNA_ORIENTATION=-